MEAAKAHMPKLEPRSAPTPTAQDERVSNAILPALAAAAVAGLIGGAIWGFIVITTGYEIGYVAWGIGVLAGYAVVHFSGGQQGTIYQAIAVVGSALGIVTGKYCQFFYLYKEAVASKRGPEIAAQITVNSAETVQALLNNLEIMVSGFDLLWVALAVLTAWSIPKQIGVKPGVSPV
jgi:hypothetical protein